ncbi:MAG: DMT family transporter [Saprospiraceae bacterium]
MTLLPLEMAFSIPKQFKHRYALLLLVVATILFALASPLIKLLVQQGGINGLQYNRAVSFCNVLFIGNLCAGIIVLIVFKPRSIATEMRKTDRKTKLLLCLSSLVAFIYPSLIFTALETTSVTNVVLLSRVEVIIFILLSLFFYKVKINLYQHVGYILIGVATLLLVLINDNFMPTRGEGLVLLAAVFFAITSIINKELLKRTTVKVFLFVRNFTSSIIFFFIAVYLYGWDHFSDAFKGELWTIMLFYALIIIVLGQFIWFRNVPRVQFSTVTWLLILNPFLTIFFAWLILDEVPTIYEGIAIVAIFVGMMIAQIGSYRLRSVYSNVESTLVGG